MHDDRLLIYSLASNVIGTEAAVALSIAMETMSNLQYLEWVTWGNLQIS